MIHRWRSQAIDEKKKKAFSKIVNEQEANFRKKFTVTFSKSTSSHHSPDTANINKRNQIDL